MGQLKNLHKAALVSFKAATVAGLKVEGYNFADVVGKARADAEARFSDGAQEIVVTKGDALWEWEEELRLLRDEIQAVADQLRKDETKKMVNAIEVCDGSPSCVGILTGYVAQFQEANLGTCRFAIRQANARDLGQRSSDLQEYTCGF